MTSHLPGPGNATGEVRGAHFMPIYYTPIYYTPIYYMLMFQMVNQCTGKRKLKDYVEIVSDRWNVY
jgi:hypothetical protein